jgi:hypothetical protein
VHQQSVTGPTAAAAPAAAAAAAAAASGQVAQLGPSSPSGAEVLEAHRHRVLHGEWKRAVAALSSRISLQVGTPPSIGEIVSLLCCAAVTSRKTCALHIDPIGSG